MRALLLVLTFGLLAFAAGFYYGRQERVQGAGPSPAAPLPAPLAAAPPARQPLVLRVSLIGVDGQPLTTVTGLVLGQYRRVVLPLEALDGAQSALAETSAGPVAIGPVVAVLPAVGLAALEGPEGGLPVAAQSASLRLGLGVQAIDGEQRIPGEVESTPTRREDGSYTCRVQLQAVVSANVAPLTDESGETLIGALLTDGGTDGSYDAVDAGALQALAASDMSPAALDEFAARFFIEQPEGRLIRFHHAIAASDWDAAIALGRELHDLGWSYSDAVSESLSQAYLHAAQQLRDRPVDGIALLDEAAGMLGEDADRLQERAGLLSAQGDPLAAIRAQSAAARLDPGLLEGLRRNVLAVAAQTTLASADRIAALNDALRDDPAYAPYSAALGRLYYSEGRYVDAAATLESALGQDAALDAELGGLLATARQRLRTPGETVAPLHAAGGSLFVYANVGGRTMRFVVDTGASYTALSVEAARSLGIVGPVNYSQVMLSTAGGLVNAPLITLSAIDVNGASVQQIPVVLLESTAPFEGLLGMTFLDHFNVSIDRTAGQIRLVRR